jgi:hypothetical protein
MMTVLTSANDHSRLDLGIIGTGLSQLYVACMREIYYAREQLAAMGYERPFLMSSARSSRQDGPWIRRNSIREEAFTSSGGSSTGGTGGSLSGGDCGGGSCSGGGSSTGGRCADRLLVSNAGSVVIAISRESRTIVARENTVAWRWYCPAAGATTQLASRNIQRNESQSLGRKKRTIRCPITLRLVLWRQ